MKNINHSNTLILGIGNNGRQDDGLGWQFLEAIDHMRQFKGMTEQRYQLNIEDAEFILPFENVIFVDAFSGSLEKGFSFEEVIPEGSFELSTHSLDPPAVVYLSQSLYNWQGSAYVMKIQGSSWELQFGLSKTALKHMSWAVQYFFDECLGESNDQSQLAG